MIEWMEDVLDRIKYKILDCRGKWRHNHKVLHIRSIKGRGWVDRDHVMLCACFQVLCDFLDKECSPGYVDWGFDPDHKRVMKEMRELEHWWKFDPLAVDASFIPDDVEVLSSSEEDITNSYTDLYYLPEDSEWISAVIKSMPDELRSKPWAILHAIERAAVERQQKMLHRLITIRPYLWT